ncbi:MAG: hypothetical protein HON04_06150 [Planctomicrobium sp.]|jgi:hypothetical protein|nr:hypothetical protein [Planctomicrobium sp.]
MATSYRFQRAGEESEPVDFRKLVQLVRNEVLLADDLVIADWQNEWGPAAEVVGLFHTAGRDDVLKRWEQEQREKKRRELLDAGEDGIEIESLLKNEDSLHKHSDSLARLEQAEAERLEALRQRRDTDQLEVNDQKNVQAAVGSALSEFDERERRRQQKSIISFLTVGTLQSMFRMAMALGVANLVTYLVFSWSQTELQKFPDKRSTSKEMKVFPIYGKCSDAEYLFLMFDTMIVAGIAGYGLARGLELFVDD